MAGRFEGKTALVTGGSRGIGRAIVEALTKEGAKVYALGKSKENLEKLQSKLPSVNIVQADVSDWDSTRHAVKELGIIDILVNNAGTVGPLTQVIDTEKSTFEHVIDTNFKGSFNIAQVVSSGLVSAGRPGVIVNMSSIYGLKPIEKGMSYCVSKAMMEMMTKSMALELGPHRIRVNCVNPTFVRTDLTESFMDNEEFISPILQRHPLGQFSQLKDVIDATLWLLSDEASMVTGTSLPVVSSGLVSAGRPGVIVNMSSIYGLRPFEKGVSYCVSKAMMEMMTKSMALELGPHRIRVNCVNPAFVRTDMTEPFMDNKEFITPVLQRHPLGHFGQVKDVVDATLWLLSDEAAMVTGTSLPVDGGYVIS